MSGNGHFSATTSLPVAPIKQPCAPSITITSYSNSQHPNREREAHHHTSIASTNTTSSVTTVTTLTKTDSGIESVPQEKYGHNYFSQKMVELPPLPHEDVTQGSAKLPLEIANFMIRVRNSSADGSDTHGQHSLSQQSDSSGKKSKESLLDGQGNVAARSDEMTKPPSLYNPLHHAEVSEFVLQSNSYPSVEQDRREASHKIQHLENTFDENNSASVSAPRLLASYNPVSSTEPVALPQLVELDSAQVGIESHSSSQRAVSSSSQASKISEDPEGQFGRPVSGGSQQAESLSIGRNGSVGEEHRQHPKVDATGRTLSDSIPPEYPQEETERSMSRTHSLPTSQDIQRHQQQLHQHRAASGERRAGPEASLSSRSFNLRAHQQEQQQVRLTCHIIMVTEKDVYI